MTDQPISAATAGPFATGVNGINNATCHHGDGWEHPSDGTLPCRRRRRLTELRRWLRAIDEGFGYINFDGVIRRGK